MTETRVRRILLATLLAVGAFVVLLVAPMHTDAAINPQINFQGKLTNPDGTNVTSGTYSIVFSLYTVVSGGTAVWTETQSSVSIVDGIFQVNLGSVTALPGSVDFKSANIYLGVKVGSDAEMTPRIPFTAAPYAFNASTADDANQLGGIASSGYVQLSPSAQQTGNINISGNITSAGAGNNSFAGTLQSAAYLLGTGPDLSLQPVVGGQSVVTSWWGLQLVGNKQSSVSYTPSNIGTAGQYGVLIPAQQAGAVALLVQGASGQTGDLLQVQNSSGNVLTKIDASGNVTFAANIVSTGLYNTNTFTSNSLIFGGADSTAIQSATGQALAVSSGTTGALTLDSGTTGAINLGTGSNAKVVTVGNTTAGTTITQKIGNGSTAFTIQGASNTFLAVNATSNQIDIGGSGAVTSPTLLVLGLKSTTSDPTGTPGALYYNTADGDYRAYQDSAWATIQPVRYAYLSSAISTTSTTYADVTGMSFTVEANKNYEFSCSVIYRSVVTTTGIGISLNGPSSPTSIVGQFVSNSSSTALNGRSFNAYNGTGKTTGVQTANADTYGLFNASFRNGSNAGTLTLRYATEVSGSAITLRAGTYCKITEI